MSARAQLPMQNSRSMCYRISERSVLKGVFPFGGSERLTFSHLNTVEVQSFRKVLAEFLIYS